jgi:hypothetical protein
LLLRFSSIATDLYLYLFMPAIIQTHVQHVIAKLAGHFFHILAARPKRAVLLRICYWPTTASEKLQQLQLCKRPCLIHAGCKHFRRNCISVGRNRTQRSSLPCAHLVLSVTQGWHCAPRGGHPCKSTCSCLSDSGSIQVYHAPKFCSTCKWPRFCCGYMQTKEADTKRTKARVKTKQQLDIAFQHPDVWMCHRFFGITTWLRRWRYRMYLQRASLQSEALLPTLADGVLSGLRGCFSFLLTSFLFLVAAVSTSVLAWHRSNCRHCYPHTFGCSSGEKSWCISS